MGDLGVRLRVDSKGRIFLPSEMREEVGEVVVVRRTPRGILIQPGRRKDFLADFRETIMSEPERTGEPENWSPEKMKEIWGR